MSHLGGLALHFSGLAGLAILLAMGPTPVAAQSLPATPARTEAITAGPYNLSVNLYSNPLRSGEAAAISISPLPGSAPLEGAKLSMVARPGPGTDASSGRTIPLAANQATGGLYAGQLTLEVRGAYLLEIDVAGPAGSASATVPLNVSAPAAIPVWLGWLIGLGPALVGLTLFGLWNKSYLGKLKLEGMVPA